ncbi:MULTISPECIES: YlbL family protein [Actinokineospora]|uniref:YlbL family protein n=1 Tax=Actinokineospora TaxID=39845 RepID=UPI001E2F649D|nr:MULTISPECIES: PDZ domain-containing protein [Actinokineospora]
MSTVAAQDPVPAPPDSQRGLSRRGWTVLVGFVLALVFAVLGATVPIPYVSLGPGPTYDTLGSVDGVAIVQVEGEQTYETTGQLRMTTVSVNDDITLFGALALWVSGRFALAPREEYFPPGETEEQIEQQNTKLFEDSQSNAETAALRHLDYPMKVIAQQITTGAPADKVLAPGDEIAEVNGRKIAQADDVRAALAGTRPGDAVPITYVRGGVTETATITLGDAAAFGADAREEGFIGLGVVDQPEVDFTTTITLEDVGGPSAGLMFSLAIVDRLTEGDLADGQIIAGTGEITTQGVVGPIGGIAFKMTAAAEAGATTFLVPAANCAEAVDNAPEGLRLVRVETLEGAVQSLKDLEAGRQVPLCTAG